MTRCVILGAILLVGARATNAQQWEGEAHASYSRTTQSHQRSWGAGAQVATTFGQSSAPLQLGMSLGGDWLSQEGGGPTQWSISYEPTIQPGGNHALTPYVGGSISANWISGAAAPPGALLGLEAIFGLELKLESQGPLSLKFELRPGYVRTQEHSVDGRFGVSWKL